MAMSTTKGTVSNDELAALQETVASTIGVDSGNIKDFAVVITSKRRRLLSSYAWDLTFDVVIALSSTSSASSTSFSESIATSLESNLSSEVASSSLAMTVAVESVSYVMSTRNPSAVPTPPPSSSPSPVPTFKRRGSDDAFSAAAGVALVALVVLVGVAVAVYRYRTREVKSAESTIETLTMETTEMREEIGDITLIEMPLPSENKPAPGSIAFFLQHDVHIGASRVPELVRNFLEKGYVSIDNIEGMLAKELSHDHLMSVGFQLVEERKFRAAVRKLQLVATTCEPNRDEANDLEANNEVKGLGVVGSEQTSEADLITASNKFEERLERPREQQQEGRLKGLSALSGDFNGGPDQEPAVNEASRFGMEQAALPMPNQGQGQDRSAVESPSGDHRLGSGGLVHNASTTL